MSKLPLSWAPYFLNVADVVRSKSKDPSTQVGAVIVGPNDQIISTGFNGFPREIDESIPDRWERPLKYSYVEHAERNAIYNAARHGIALQGCTMYISGLGPPNVPCVDCARAVIQSGIVYIVGRSSKPASGTWPDNLALAYDMLTEAGVRVV